MTKAVSSGSIGALPYSSPSDHEGESTTDEVSKSVASTLTLGVTLESSTKEDAGSESLRRNPSRTTGKRMEKMMKQFDSKKKGECDFRIQEEFHGV